MKRQIITVLAMTPFVFMLALAGCTRDVVSDITGSYKGSYVVRGHSFSSITEISKNGNEHANFTFFNDISGSLRGIRIEPDHTFNYVGTAVTFSGAVSGNRLTWTMIDDTETIIFTGTKQ